MKRKNLFLGALAVCLACVIALGGTLAWLTDTSDAVTNEFTKNHNDVELDETGGTRDEDGTLTDDHFSIVPGGSETKDPYVTVNYTLDSYVYVVITDNTYYTDEEGNLVNLVNWYIASGWLVLDVDTDENVTVLYQLVTTEDADSCANGVYTKTIAILRDDTVSYPASLTKEQINSTEEAASLRFNAYVCQAQLSDSENPADALTCYYIAVGGNVSSAEAEDGTTTYVTTAALTLTNGGVTAYLPAGVSVEESAISSGTARMSVSLTRVDLPDEVAVDEINSGLSYQVSIDGLAECNTQTITITTIISSGLTITGAYAEDGSALTEGVDYAYDSESGSLTLYVIGNGVVTLTCSTGTITINGTEYYTVAAADVAAVDAGYTVRSVSCGYYTTTNTAINASAYKEGVMTLVADSTLTTGQYGVSGYPISFNLNGNTLNVSGSTGYLNLYWTSEIYGGTLSMASGKNLCGAWNNSQPNVSIWDCTLKMNGGNVYINTGTMTITDTVIEGAKNIYAYDSGTLTLENCTVTASAIYPSNSSGSIYIISGDYTGVSSIYNNVGGTLVIAGGTFSVDPTAFVDADSYDVTYENGVYTVTAKGAAE